MKRYRFIAGVALILSIGILILPRVIPICAGMMMTHDGGTIPMRCHYAYQAEFLIALLGVVVAGSLFAVRQAETRLLAGVLLFLIGIIIVVLPQSWAIGICQHAGSACQSTTLWITAGGSLFSLCGILIGYVVWHSVRSDG